MKFKQYLTEGEKWSSDVETKWTPPEGLFSTGSSQEIADTLSKGSDLKTAMSRLNFYLNRAGKNIKTKDRTRVEKAKPLIQKKFKGE